MDRRNFIARTAGTSLIATAGLNAFPAIGKTASEKVLRFVPQADLANFDPITASQIVVRNAAVMVWDMLYGLDSQMRPQPQMVESESVSSNGLVWTFKLRGGLKFHDGTPVLARDVVASLNRWSVRDAMGKLIREVQKELVATDDKTFRWTLSKPFPKMKFALAKLNTPCAFIMPERLAKTDPFQQVSEYIGSGPMRFVKNEWVPGSKAVFEKFGDYVPRQEPNSWMAGGKVMLVDRVEWLTMTDPSTAAAAMQNGEIDWWETPISDLVPLLRSNSGVNVDILDTSGNVGAFLMNHLQPPFNNLLARQAVMTALNQQDYMEAVVGDDKKLWKPMYSFFTPGTPAYTEAGADILKGARRMDAAKKLLEKSGYANEQVTCLIAENQSIVKPMGDVSVDLLKKLGMNVNVVSTDWATVGSRRTNKGPANQGGWSMFHSWFSGMSCTAPYSQLRGNGENAWFGWPTSPGTEKGIADWFDTSDAAREKAALEQINRAAMQDVVYAPTGFFLSYSAWRKNVRGISKGPLPMFWGVSKA